jgi:16S rRNA (guanine527-N7)-methyltransferase
MEKAKLIDISQKEIKDNEDRLRQYIHLLSEANDIARLTGPSDETILWDNHLLDCAAALPLLPDKGRIIDVGTGGGLPGMVWATCRPDLTVTLLDSIAKKCALVEKIATAMNLKNVTVVCSRSEDYARLNNEKFNVAAARAVCASGILAEYLAPFVKIRGKAIAFKGPRVADELLVVGNKWETLGFAPPKLTPYTLGEIKRYLLVWDKVSQTTKGIPRRPGMAEKFPWYTKK